MAPKKVLGLKEQLIFNDLKLMHQIKHGRPPVDFDEFFAISDIEKNGNEKIEPNTFKHSFAKHSFICTGTIYQSRHETYHRHFSR